MLEAFQRALMQPAGEVFGVSLKPYTLAHSAMLSMLNNPFAEDSETDTANIGELGTAAAVLTVDPSRVFSLTVDEYADIANGIGERAASLNLEAEAAKLREHLASFRAVPERWVSKGNGKSLSSPWQFLAVVRLLSCGLVRSEPEAWAMPCGRALCLISAYDELNGTVELVSEKEAQIMEAAQ